MSRARFSTEKRASDPLHTYYEAGSLGHTEDKMSLKEITTRHLRDRWRDALFLGVAVILTALAIGSVTSKAVGTTTQPKYHLTIEDGTQELNK
jgi:hypothetical protein